MRHIIALCLNLKELMENDNYRKTDVCAKYPGAGWIPFFTTYAEFEGFEVKTGRECVNCSVAQPDTRIYVIQEELNNYGNVLRIIDKADSTLSFCLESPLYAPRYYDWSRSFSNQFYKSMTFQSEGGVHFPSFNLSALAKEPKPWGKRKKKICAIMSNKHFSQLGNKWAHSLTWQKALKSELHTQRLHFLQEAREYGWDIYGHGYPKESGIVPIDDKRAVLEEYQFSFCYENCIWPGYVTEKPIECVVAGTIPIYETSHPDLQAFSIPTVEHYLKMDTSDIYENLEALMEYRNSQAIQKFSFQSFAKEMADYIVGRRQMLDLTSPSDKDRVGHPEEQS